MAEEKPEVSELEMSTLGADEMARVEALLAPAQSQKEPSKRSAMQDYTAFLLYLNASIWELYKSGADSLQLLEAVVHWLAEKFLLRCPSESTLGCLAAFTIMRDSDESRQRTLRTPDVLLATTKAQVASVLAKYKYDKVTQEKYLLKLPLDRAKLPPHLQEHVKLCAPPEVKLSDLLITARKIPLRGRAKMGNSVTHNADAGNVMHALNALSGLVGLAQILQQGQQGQHDGLNLQYAQPPKKTGSSALHALLNRDAASEQLPSTTALSSSAAPSRMLAITDAPQAHPETQSAPATVCVPVAPSSLVPDVVPCRY